ncbi:hypothetical protein RRG08_051953 [Elysia crispata]|uniref:Uncharacterized protein n=1 Tax=Elysia crispata TaxID=231223 RepID=A0AAE0Y1U4_9GAST|nr:hypothetical protein RRG08_051953 [Elysia crispata]
MATPINPSPASPAPQSLKEAGVTLSQSMDSVNTAVEEEPEEINPSPDLSSVNKLRRAERAKVGAAVAGSTLGDKTESETKRFGPRKNRQWR